MVWVGLGLVILNVLSCQVLMESLEQVSSLAHLDLVLFETSKNAKKTSYIYTYIDYLEKSHFKTISMFQEGTKIWAMINPKKKYCTI